MTDVFISYSRKDKELTLQLHAELSKLNRDVWVDWEDIPATADWLREIYANIEKTDAFLFLVSPNSITSLVCNLEIAHAVKFNKRLVPIIYDNVDFDAVLKEAASIQPDTATQLILGEHSLSTMMRENWKSLSRHNWLFFRDEQEFQANFPKLIQAIDTDLEYVHDHTRWLVRALEWEAKDYNASFLLSGAQLREAEHWLADSGAKEPILNKLHTEYILASRRRDGQRQRTLFVAVLAALVIAVALAVFGFIQSQAAQSALGVAEARGTDAANNAGTAIANADIATIAQGQAQIEADNAATQAVAAQNAATAESDARATSVVNAQNAINNAATATIAQGQAQVAATAESYARATSVVNEQNALNAQATSIINEQIAVDAQATSAVNEQDARNSAATATLALGQVQIEADNAATQAAAAQLAATAESNARATSIANEQIALDAQATSVVNAQNAINNAATATIAQGQAQVAATAESYARATSVVNEQNALNAQATSGVNEQIALDAQATSMVNAQNAINNAATAVIAQEQAQNEAVRALAAQATAEQRANETQSLALTVAVEQLLSLGNPDLALALALEAGQVDPNSWVAQNRLLKVAFAPGTHLVFAPGHTGPITHLVYSPDGQVVASSSLDGTIILWDANTGQQIRRFVGHGEGVNTVAFNTDGTTLISASDDNSLILWNMDGQQIRSFRRINEPGADLNRDATAAVFRFDGQSVVSSWADGQVVIFDYNGSERVTLPVANSPIIDLDLSPDRPGQFFLAVSNTSVEVWDTRAQAQRQIFVGSGGAGAYSPDGNYVLISAASDRSFNSEGHDLI
ncbi:MAG: TIR domain-containing protein, partial [Anaerolineae bacterium]|nr:TIR domain-containing protein [Anaerolineae bacterium]